LSQVDVIAHIISAWRDHTVLVHTGREKWKLSQSLNNHRLGVNYARFYDKCKFITSSLDRTVVLSQIEETEGIIGVQIIRTINLARSHAVDIEMASESNIVISTSDRQVLTYDISSGDLLHAYKTADSSDMITLGNMGISKTFLFPPLMKVKTMGSPVPQGQVRPRSLLAGAGNDKVLPPLRFIKLIVSQFGCMTMIQGHY
jgi:WD40 repeat protein